MGENGDNLNRTQPEFSLGERLARVESILDPNTGLKAQVNDLLNAEKELTEEKVKGVRTELGAINQAQKEAITKAEEATGKRLSDISDQGDRRAEVTNSRLGALEQNESKGAGKDEGAKAFWAIFVSVVTILISVTVVLVTLFTH